MADREKVINAFVICRVNDGCSTNCPYWNGNASVKECTMKLATDVYSLLKEKEAKPVDLYGKDDWYGLVCVCPDCKAEWMGDESETHFCPNCGRKVKWE